MVDGSGDATSLLGMDGFVVRASKLVDGEWCLSVESTAALGCPDCGVRANDSDLPSNPSFLLRNDSAGYVLSVRELDEFGRRSVSDPTHSAGPCRPTRSAVCATEEFRPHLRYWTHSPASDVESDVRVGPVQPRTVPAAITHRNRGGALGSASRKIRTGALALAVLVALVAAACSSTNSTPTTTTSTSGGGGGSSIPTSAMSDHTGISSTSVHLANVSTMTGGLFKGAAVGTQAFADYINSTGGVNGRTIVVDSGDDQFTGAANKQETQSAINSDFALVGGFSLEDGFGGTLLAHTPGMPDVTVTLDPATNKLPNVYSPAPSSNGWEEGPLQYFKAKYPRDIQSVGTLIAIVPSALPGWNGEKYAMEKIGYKVVYQTTFALTQTDFTQNVIAMKNAGVKMLFIDQMPENYAASVLKAMVQQNYHPVVVLGAAAYSNALVESAGGPSAVNGDYLDQNYSLYLGQDAAAIPAVGTFLHWVNVASPGYKPDLFSLYGWISGELFAQGLKNAGSNPSRGSLLEALNKITTFDASHVIAPNNPVAKTLSNCYLLGQVANGSFQRLDDPPVGGSTHGYRCDYQYVKPPGA